MNTSLIRQLAFVIPLFTVLQTRAQQDLIAHWEFDEGTGTTVADASGRGNVGNFVNPPVWTNGLLSGALSFDGVNDYLEVPHSATLDIADDITVAAWIKRTALGKYGGLVTKTDGANVWDYDLYISGNTPTFWSDAQSPQGAACPCNITDLEWHHVAVTRTADTVTFYIDGLEAGTVSVSGNNNVNDLPVRIGTDGPQYSADSMFRGLIDDVRIYSRALSGAEILALYPNLPFPITTQPADATTAVGFTAQFSVRASPSFGVTHQWYKGQTAIAGATSPDYITSLLTAQDNGSQYSVILKNQAGLSATSRVATLTVAAPVFSPGFLKREVYKDIPGNPVADLTSSPKFPNSPDESVIVAGFEAPTDINDQYGQRVSGFITPQETAKYIFFLATDDGGELWLSTDESPANKALIAWEPEWNPARDWIATTRRNPDNPENRSQPISLTAGKRYYVEALQKEGTGGDNLGVTAIKEGDPLPLAGSPPLQGTWIGASGPPSTGAITITKQPVDVTALPGKTATFTAEATHSASGILVYQWQRDGKDIFRANGTSYTTPTVSASDDGATFRCVIYAQGGISNTTQAARLTVSADVTAPTILTAVRSYSNPNQVIVKFSEPLGTSASTAANYRINGTAATGAALSSNKTIVALTSSSAVATNATLTVTGVTDLAGNPIAANTSIILTLQKVVYFVTTDPGTEAEPLTFAGDIAVRERLLDRAFEVITARGADVPDDGSTALGTDLIIQSSSLTSGTVETTDPNGGPAIGKFKNLAIPGIEWEASSQDAWGFQSANGTTTANQTQLSIVDPASPLAAGLSAGIHTVVQSAEPFSQGTPTGAHIVATLAADPNQAIIYSYEKGDKGFNDFVMPARRVFFFFGDDTMAVVNEEGLKLFDAAVDWALNLIPAGGDKPVITATRNGNQLTISWTNGGTLESSLTLAPASWTTLSSNTPHTIDITQDKARFFRVKK